MATLEDIREVKELFDEREKESKKIKNKIKNKYQYQSYNLDPTNPKIWLEMWEAYNLQYTNSLTKIEIKKMICDTTELKPTNAKKSVDIAIELDVLTKTTKQNQLEYFPANPNMRPELYLCNVESYIDVDIWKKLWENQEFSKIDVIDKSQFNNACEEFFNKYNKYEIKAIKELGLVSNIISESDDGIIFVGLRED